MSITTKNKYPFFELSEIIPELELQYRPYKPLSPVKAGNFIPEINLQPVYDRWQQFYNGAETHGPILLRLLQNKPLVISFYSHHWKNQGLEQLKQLNELQYEVKANGGNLLVITGDRDGNLQKIAWENNLSLSFYFDENNELAKRFRIFSDDNPIWNRFSGVDVNVPLLATYVLDASRQVVYDHIDWDFEIALPAENIIDAVYESSLVATSRKSA